MHTFNTPHAHRIVAAFLYVRAVHQSSWSGVQINNGVYKSGFATSQVGYDRAQEGLYAALRHVDELLASHRFLLGDRCPSPLNATPLSASPHATMACSHTPAAYRLHLHPSMFVLMCFFLFPQTSD